VQATAAAPPGAHWDNIVVPSQCIVLVYVTYVVFGRAETKPQLFQYDGSLSEVDPDIYDIIKKEKGRQACSLAHAVWCCRPVAAPLSHTGFAPCRQVQGLELIASENFTSRAVRADSCSYGRLLQVEAATTAADGAAGACHMAAVCCQHADTDSSALKQCCLVWTWRCQLMMVSMP
jgi:hypothetical protein